MSAAQIPRWLIATLVISLVVNLLLVGFIAGRMSSGNLPAAMPPAGLMWMVRALPEQRRQEVRGIVRRHGRALFNELRQAGSARDQLIASLEAEPFDAELARQSTASMRTHMDAAQQHNFAGLIEIAARLPHAERLSLARALRDMGRHERPRAGRPGGGPPRP